MPDEQATNPNADRQLNVDADRLHLAVTPIELNIIVDALRSVGNCELAERFEPSYATQAMGRVVSDAPEPDDADGRSQDEQSRVANPPSVEGRCHRCGWRGKVYPGRYGGLRCAVCFGLQWGWMPRE